MIRFFEVVLQIRRIFRKLPLTALPFPNLTAANKSDEKVTCTLKNIEHVQIHFFPDFSRKCSERVLKQYGTEHVLVRFAAFCHFSPLCRQRRKVTKGD